MPMKTKLDTIYSGTVYCASYKTTAGRMRGSTAMIEKERQSELIRKFVVSQEMPDDEITDLSLDELTYIYFNTEIAKKDEKYKAIHFPIKQQIIYWGVVDAIKKAEIGRASCRERV